ncbi:MAG TPA: GNAT family N-acetyltransferase [Longimicrobiales bacterium]|nr:GNAT family N-acetyltransferase [Longimicrobiales bacterium]
MPDIRYATREDREFVGQDGYLPVDVLIRKIDDNEVVVADEAGVPLGYARIEFLWSRLPYITLIRVRHDRRRQGVGRALLEFIEKELNGRGYNLLLSSSQSNEQEPQQWHIHMGFGECGRLRGLNDDGSEEVFFRKELR